MARKTRKRFYKRATWSTRINNITLNKTFTSNSQGAMATTLCTNPAQQDSTVSNKYTVKNVELDLEIEIRGDNTNMFLENFQAYVIYLPQGYQDTEVALQSLPYNHPEYIMAYRFIGTPMADASTSYLPLRIKSRLARKLDTGDRIMLVVLGQNTNTANISYVIDAQGLVKYNTKAN